MEKTELTKLFSLLRQFFPNKQISDDMTLAWRYALEPYRYDDVKNAVLAHVRQSRYFPDISELVKLLPQAEEKEYLTPQRKAEMKKYIDKLFEARREK